MKPVEPRAFGARVRARRKRLGIPSQKALGALIGVPQQTIANIESGGVERPRFMRELAGVLGTSEEWLFWEEGPEEVGSPNLYTAEQLVDLAKKIDPVRLKVLIRMVEIMANAA